MTRSLITPYGAAPGSGEIIDHEPTDVPVMTDLYQGVKVAVGNHPGVTAIYIMTDWEDGDDPLATQSLIASLRMMHIKLYLCSVEKEPYKGLVDYAKESGGSYVHMTKDFIETLRPPDGQ